MFIAARRGAQLQPQQIIPIIRRTLLAHWLTSLLAVGVAYAEPLSFTAALQLAEQSSPELSVQRADLAAAQASAVAAGRLPDPKLIAGVDNVPINGVEQWSLDRDFMTMRKIGVMQDIPNARKRQAQIDVAAATIHRTELQQRAQRLTVRRAAAVAWLNRYYLEQQLGLLDELDRENRLFTDTVQAQLSAGRGVPADALAPKQEAVELADRRDVLLTDIVKAKATLRRYVGAASDEPLVDAAPVLAIDAEHLRATVHEHPELAVFAPLHDVAQAELREAQAAKRPDWGVELSYAQRGPDYSDMVSAQVTIGLPLFGGSRQDPLIAAKRQALTRVNAEREVMLRDHTEQLEAELADEQTLQRQLTRLKNTRLPLAQQKVELQLASYQAGTGDLNAVLAARRELVETQLKSIELENQHAAIAAALYFAYGEGSL